MEKDRDVEVELHTVGLRGARGAAGRGRGSRAPPAEGSRKRQRDEGPLPRGQPEEILPADSTGEESQELESVAQPPKKARGRATRSELGQARRQREPETPPLGTPASDEDDPISRTRDWVDAADHVSQNLSFNRSGDTTSQLVDAIQDTLRAVREASSVGVNSKIAHRLKVNKKLPSFTGNALEW